MTRPQKERQEQLARTWQLLADAMLRSLESEAPSAASLECVRKFLADNGCTADTLMLWRSGGLGFDPGSLPTFSDDEGGKQGGSAASDKAALMRVPPFAPADD